MLQIWMSLICFQFTRVNDNAYPVCILLRKYKKIDWLVYSFAFPEIKSFKQQRITTYKLTFTCCSRNRFLKIWSVLNIHVSFNNVDHDKLLNKWVPCIQMQTLTTNLKTIESCLQRRPHKFLQTLIVGSTAKSEWQHQILAWVDLSPSRQFSPRGFLSLRRLR